MGPIFCDRLDGIDYCIGQMGLMGLILMMGQKLSERNPLAPHQSVDRHICVQNGTPPPLDQPTRVPEESKILGFDFQSDLFKDFLGR